MTIGELKIWIEQSDVEDAWWVNLNGDLIAEPMTLNEILKLPKESDTRLKIIHTKHSKESKSGWIEVSFEEGIRASARRRDFRRKSREAKINNKRIVRQLLGLLVVAVVTFSVIILRDFDFREFWNPTPEISLERANDSLDSGSSGKMIWAEVAVTRRILYVYNKTKFDWPLFRVYLNVPDGFSFESNSPLQSNGVLAISLREFKKGAETIDVGSYKIVKVGIEVPGFRTWETNTK